MTGGAHPAHCAACPRVPGADCLGAISPAACVHVARGRADWIALVATGEGATPGTAGAAPCRHRSADRWCCGEGLVYCALGHGQAGIIEPEHCRGCSDADP